MDWLVVSGIYKLRKMNIQTTCYGLIGLIWNLQAVNSERTDHLRIHAFSSPPSLFVEIFYSIYWFQMRTTSIAQTKLFQGWLISCLSTIKMYRITLIFTQACANSADPDQGQHCLLYVKQFQTHSHLVKLTGLRNMFTLPLVSLLGHH